MFGVTTLLIKLTFLYKRGISETTVDWRTHRIIGLHAEWFCGSLKRDRHINPILRQAKHASDKPIATHLLVQRGTRKALPPTLCGFPSLFQAGRRLRCSQRFTWLSRDGRCKRLAAEARPRDGRPLCCIRYRAM